MTAKPGFAKPRIAVVGPSLEILGGQGVQAKALLDGLDADGWPTELVPINPRFPRGLRWLRAVPYARTVLNQVLYAASLLRLRRADVVHVFSASYASFLLAPVPAMLAARAFGRRTVLNYHSGEAEDHLANWGRAVHPWLRLADRIVVPSDYLAGVFAAFGYETQVVANVVDATHFRFRRRAPLAPRWLSIRNLERHYRVDDVLRAFAIFREGRPDATLDVAGYGSQEAELHRLADELGRDGIRFHGRVEPASLPALFDACDVFVNASVVDNQPVSILEAFAAGLPVVSTPIGDVPHMLADGERGWLTPFREPEALALTVTQVLADTEATAAKVDAARAAVDHFTWPAVRDGWTRAYVGEDAR